MSSKNQVTKDLAFPDSIYDSIWSFARNKKGYSGVVTYFNNNKLKCIEANEGIGNTKLDDEGRCVVLDCGYFVLFNVYFPNGGMGEDRLKFKLEYYDHVIETIRNLVKQGRHVLVVGDVNTAHREIDVHNPSTAAKCTGFLPEERKFFDTLMDDSQNEAKFIDSYRYFHPDEKDAYTWWDPKTGARTRNKGWRLDYILGNAELIKNFAKDANILKDVLGSDHCPISIDLEFDEKEFNVPKVPSDEMKNVCSKYFEQFNTKQMKQTNIFDFLKKRKKEGDGEENKLKKAKVEKS